MKRISVLVVDDSPTMRQLVARTLAADPELDVVATAASAIEARELIKQLSPDVMTLDVEMPDMDGLSFLERGLRLRPMPVLKVSTLPPNGPPRSVQTTVTSVSWGTQEISSTPSGEDSAPYLRELVASSCTTSANVVAACSPTPMRGTETRTRPLNAPMSS